jgi:hypothetical protein
MAHSLGLRIIRTENVSSLERILARWRPVSPPLSQQPPTKLMITSRLNAARDFVYLDYESLFNL